MSDLVQNLKLTIQTRLPKYAQHKNLRAVIPGSLWDKIRKKVYEEANFQCSICGYSEGSLEAHEIWDFDEEKCLLILTDIKALCYLCHCTKHYHHAARRSTELAKKLKQHFIKVNECSIETWKDHLLEVRKQESDLYRLLHEPSLDGSEFVKHLKDFRKKEQYLSKQKWLYLIPEHIPYSEEIKQHLKRKSLLFNQ
jgi:5-methylcytosine-specific restriction endonuclease McrA